MEHIQLFHNLYEIVSSIFVLQITLNRLDVLFQNLSWNLGLLRNTWLTMWLTVFANIYLFCFYSKLLREKKKSKLIELGVCLGMIFGKILEMHLTFFFLYDKFRFLTKSVICKYWNFYFRLLSATKLLKIIFLVCCSSIKNVLHLFSSCSSMYLAEKNSLRSRNS